MPALEHPLKGWIPYKLIIEDKVPLVYWLYTADYSFTDPFFEETIARCKSHKYNSSNYTCVSSIESMIEWADKLPNTAPVTFIFHISRCGSTLLSQLLGLNKKNTVLSEVPFFDEILRLPYKLQSINNQFREKILQASVKFVGQKKTGEEEHLFIKTDSWHICFYKTLRLIYPSASIILLYRTPDEVVCSHQKQRGMQGVPRIIEPQIFDFNEQEINKLNLDVYTTKVLEKYFLLFEEITQQDNLALLLDYKQGAIPMIQQIAGHLKTDWDEKHILAMLDRIKFHSKHPKQTFEKEIKPPEMPNYLQDIMELYKSLEKKRNGVT
ncbi:MAG TPA: sulfotransferase family protein [Bacteroidia bacterium]|nr:sulfotransferase family protein [Bacteroidia bacterium]